MLAFATLAVVAVLAMSPAAAAGTPGTVPVRLGDTLTAIAARNHTTVAALAAANGITDPDRIVAGTVLRLPAPSAPSGAGGGQAAGANAPGAPLTVVVHLGDTLTAIAARNHTTVAALAAANGITNPNRIVAGTVLRLPVSTMALASYSAPVPGTGTGAGGFSDPGVLPAPLRSHPERLALAPAFRQAAGAAGVPASLLEALCWWESGWQAGVVSSAGAVGVCQLEPATTSFVRTTLLRQPTLDPRVAPQNITMGAAYLAYLLRQTGGDQRLALAGYYAGLASVRAHGMSSATKNYVEGIMAYAAVFARAG
ncbi:MAG TPA: LysM peptidoglycan-binding domain-containing protein [Acidimicrobiales bacterium]|nr:LysM peptidoglycan-binding domain-containing protein [Acidimicrobiales bacterium]